MTPNKETRYHLEIQVHRKNPYGQIRSNHWDNGKIHHKTTSRITGPLGGVQKGPTWRGDRRLNMTHLAAQTPVEAFARQSPRNRIFRTS